MSGLTVRSYVKMAFDSGSYQKTQQEYNGALAKLQKEGLETVGKANAGLKSQHKSFIDELDRQNKAANEKLKARTKEVTQRVRAEAERAMVRKIPGDHRVTKKGEVFKRDAKIYETSLKKMKAANASYVAHARSIGAHAKTTSTGMLHTESFAANNETMRKRLIEAQVMKTKELRRELGRNSNEYKRHVILLEQMVSVDRELTLAERERGREISKNNKLAQMSASNLRRALAQNNQFYKEQLRLQMQINQAMRGMITNLSQGLVNALMVSAIALMSFGFKLQGVIDSFKDFEKELMNAQSIFQTTNDVLFDLSDQIVEFGTKYGVSLQDASEGLYTLASAGLSAADSQEVLQNTLKLSMAVQGDHETVAKLTTQTIFGFGLEMSDSAELTDKFAHAINKSLIEYQDLASAVKFAMPFFITTGQNIDQLLGSLEILTNRALEAGIAGRGLRQALAEFAQHADDNTAAFAKLGIEVTDAEGNFLMLTEIAKNFQTQMGDMVNDTELLTTLLEDLNVRGATAFVHLVQNADEFQHAVDDLANSAGAATEMADIQQQSLANQIQVVKNALMAPFLLSTEVGKANGTMNEFGEILHGMVENFEAFFIDTLPDGTRVLTDQGAAIRDVVITAVVELSTLMQELLWTFSQLSGEGDGFRKVIHALLLPIRALNAIVGLLGEHGITALIMFKTMNMILPLTQMRTAALTIATQGLAISQMTEAINTEFSTMARKKHTLAEGLAFVMGDKTIKQNELKAISYAKISMALAASNVLLFAGMVMMSKAEGPAKILAIALIGLAGAMMGVSMAASLFDPSGSQFARWATSMGIGMGVIVTASALLMDAAMESPDIETYDMGGRIYDSGGRAGLGGRHKMIMVEPGETIVPKTQNMMGGGGITLNIGGDIVTDNADDFAERIAVALPEALRRQSDIGGL